LQNGSPFGGAEQAPPHFEQFDGSVFRLVHTPPQLV
jgi:hypothetical protein